MFCIFHPGEQQQQPSPPPPRAHYVSSFECYTLYAIAAVTDAISPAAAVVAAASSRTTNWKVIVRGLKDTADRRL